MVGRRHPADARSWPGCASAGSCGSSRRPRGTRSTPTSRTTLGDGIEVDLPGVTPGTNCERFRAKAAAYLREHEDHLALQRLRRNKQLTPDDLDVAGGDARRLRRRQQVDIAWASEQAGGLGLFVRSLVGLDRAAATEAFAALPRRAPGSPSTRSASCNLIVDELTAQRRDGAQPGSSSRPYTDHAPTGPDLIFPDADVEVIVDILRDVKQHAMPSGAA